MWKGRSGFTFLEILVALAILGSAFTVLLAAHASALRQESKARHLLTATLLARQILTETEMEGFPDLGAESGDFGEDFPGYAWERHVEPAVLPIDTAAVDALAGGTSLALPPDAIREVTIRVTWPERGGTGSTQLIYYAPGRGP